MVPENLAPPGFEPQTVRPVAIPDADYAIPAARKLVYLYKISKPWQSWPKVLPQYISSPNPYLAAQPFCGNITGFSYKFIAFWRLVSKMAASIGVDVCLKIGGRSQNTQNTEPG